MDIIPKKSLGQHWLHDQASLQAMVEAGEVSGEDLIVEIGPGLGTLTEHLLGKAKQVIALEYDKDLARTLPKRLPSNTLQVKHADCLAFDYSSLPNGYKVVANIPYYLTSNLLRVLSESANSPSLMALLVQKEVAERVVAGPGGMSLLSVSVQLYYAAELGPVVPAELFTPPPKVDSQILKLTRHPQPMFENLNHKKFFRVVKAGFSQKRKKLRSSLSAGLHISKPDAEHLLSAAGIDPNCRPQELSLDQWYRLCQQID